MKLYSQSLFILLALPCLVMGADKSAITLYLQSIHGTDDDHPPVVEARPADLELARHLQMFRWKNYWEIDRRIVHIGTGGVSRQRMSAEREVEIARPSASDITFSIYTHGKLTQRRKQSLETPFYIAGGDKEGAQSWFIVVRRDKPPEGQVSLN